MVKPWISGPKELLDHATVHLQDGNPFDFRVAMISIDNAVELTINTTLAYQGVFEDLMALQGENWKAPLAFQSYLIC